MERPMSQTKFGEMIGVSQRMVSKYILYGHIPKGCLVREGRFLKVLPLSAMEALKDNLNPLQTKGFRERWQKFAKTNKVFGINN